jgi:hypothetical protein
MTEGPIDREEALFYQAADLPPEQQRALLDAACEGDPGLRARMERLLADDARLRTGVDAADFLNSPLVRLPTTPADETRGLRPVAAAGPAPERTEPPQHPGLRPGPDQGHVPQVAQDQLPGRPRGAAALKGLESINDKPVAEFWKDVAGK